MTVTVRCSPGSRSLVLLAEGRLDLRAAWLCWLISDPGGSGCGAYAVDISHVHEISDGGLGLLLMLARRAQRSGVGMGIVDCRDGRRVRHRLRRVLLAAAEG